MTAVPFDKYMDALEDFKPFKTTGRVTQIIGLTIQVEGIRSFIGEVCEIQTGRSRKVLAEVVGFKGEASLLMPLGDLSGIGPGSLVHPTGESLKIKVGQQLIGKVLDGLGRPMTDVEMVLDGHVTVDNNPPNPLTRNPIENIMKTGVRAIDGLLTCGEGQRLGIFAGSGVGKSTLLGKIIRSSDADINIIALIGERNRELLNVINKDLGPGGMSRSIVVVATSDQPALIRSKAAFVSTAIAEYFRDQGMKVMLMMDSVTRFAMAEREVGLAIGEPPTTKGYTPSVFARLPKLLERTGTSEKGSITAFYTVLVEGDDMNEPISDAVRGILDGHIILSRKLAAKNHFPAIDVQQSISRLMTQIVNEEHNRASSVIRDLMSVYDEAEDMINVGVYNAGSNHKIDQAISVHEDIVGFLKQSSKDTSSLYETTSMMEEILRKVK